MTVSRMLVLAAMTRQQLDAIVGRLDHVAPHRRERPSSYSLRRRVLLPCVALRTNLTFRELAACAQV